MFSVFSTYKKTAYFTAACLLASLVLNLLSRYAEGFAQWYAVHLYPVFPNVLGRISSVWSRSIFEAAVLLILLTVLISLLAGFFFLFRKKPVRIRFFSAGLRFVICASAGLVLVFTLTCAVNYQRDSIGDVLKLPTEAPTAENLKKLTILLVEDLNDLTSSPEWDYGMLAAADVDYIEYQAISAMKLLGEKEPSLAGYYPKPKPVYFSKELSGVGIEGIFFPVTMEANYNNDITPFLLPYVICHEMAHVKGYMKEDDAGFIAFLASRNSPSPVFQYSGLFRALIFSLNALKTETSSEEYNEIFQRLPEPVKSQLRYVAQHYQVRESVFEPVAEKINNLYLKVNAQSGIKSYGRIVDLLIADYADRINGINLL
ncbi:MAG TPA: DUF3810 domain-containing protein [Anaerovoracaceae bacterium]|nr:DUF3810 domain-containing protein [Anaerovoracaceae bacterium]